jgi:acetate---CoA ligase (ADP-forming)
MSHPLHPLLYPKSVAMIGASNTPSRIGGRPINSMLENGYKGKIYPVNPNADMVQGLEAYSSIKDVPEAVDCAIISVNASIAVNAIQECADKGAKTAIVFTSGFAEFGEEGEKAQAEISNIAKTSGMRILGPNCLGAFNLEEEWYGTFTNAPGLRELPPGPTGIITQSGAFGAHLFVVSQMRGLRSNCIVTTGNESDIDVAEVIEYYAQSPNVKVIMAYAEGMKDSDRICDALEKAREAEKPVVFMKVGSTDVGARAAASHTASLAGSDAVYDALFKQYGVYRAETTEELVDVAYAAQFGKFPTGRKISIQSISGGVGVQMADAAEKFDLDVATLPAATQKKLKELIPFAGVNNPVDFTAQALNDPDVMEANVSLTIEEADYDCHAVYMASLPASPFTADICETIFKNLHANYPDEIMVMSLLGPREIYKKYENLTYSVYQDPSAAIRALSSLAHFGEVFKRGRPDKPDSLPTNALPAPEEPVAEHKAKEILNSIGIPVTKEFLTKSAQEAISAWKKIGAAVVLKIASPDIAHKTEIGGVLLNLNAEQEISESYELLISRAKTAHPDAFIDGVIVAEMISGGVETVLGVVRDPVFGPAVMFGLGGVFVEVLKDVTFRLAPFAKDEALKMIDEIQGRAMLDGVRGAAPSDIDALADALSKLSVFAASHADKIDSIDINPFVVHSKGAVAVDALIVPVQEAAS